MSEKSEKIDETREFLNLLLKNYPEKGRKKNVPVTLL